MRRQRNPGSAILVLLVLALAAACDDGGSPTASTRGTLTIQLTDQPIEAILEVNVFIAGLTVKRSGADVERIAGEVGVVDLLKLLDATQLLVTAGVGAGSYEFIMVELDESRSSVVEGPVPVTKPLKIPSQEVKVLGGFDVMASGETTVTLDFDASKSLHQEGNGDWLLEPVIVMESVETR